MIVACVHGAPPGGTPSLIIADERPELGRLAAWTVSSHKYGFGVNNLRDGNDNTFWQ